MRAWCDVLGAGSRRPTWEQMEKLADMRAWEATMLASVASTSMGQNTVRGTVFHCARSACTCDSTGERGTRTVHVLLWHTVWSGSRKGHPCPRAW